MTGLRARALIVGGVFLAAIALTLGFGALGAPQVSMWLNAPAFMLAFALGGNVHWAGAPFIYFTFPFQWLVIGLGLSFLIRRRSGIRGGRA